MKKVISVVISLMMIGALYGTSFAGSNSENGSLYSTGALKVDVSAFGTGVSADGKILPRLSGAAGGIGGAIGGAEADAKGFVFNGSVEAELEVWGGGLTNTTAYREFNTLDADKSVKVGSYTSTQSVTGVTAKAKVDPDGKLIWGFIPTAGRAVGVNASGFTAQGSLNGSIVGNSPLADWETDGVSAGVAGQGSIGGWEAELGAISGPDYTKGYYKPHPVDSKEAGGFGAEIEMIGFSYSESYRYINDDEGVHTEGMGTNIGAGTTVNSYGYDYEWDKGLSESCSNLAGGFVVAGGAGSKTVQYNNTGKATASTVGFYTGGGSLGTNYNGKAIGYTNTSITTVDGMNGTISSSSAGMSVTSNTSGNRPQ